MSSRLKSAGRALFGLIEGLSWVMRECASDFSQDCGLVLDEKTRLKLVEKRRGGPDRRVMDQYLETKKRVKLGFDYFPKLFGVAYQLKTQERGWQDLLTFFEVRNTFTHPRTLEGAYAPALASLLSPVAAWYSGQTAAMLAACGAEGSPEQTDSYQPVTLPTEMLSARDMQRIRDEPLLSIRYAQKALGVLFTDASTCFSPLTQGGVLTSSEAQPVLRNFTRALYSAAEGMTWVAEFFLRAAAERNELTIPEPPKKWVTFYEKLRWWLTQWSTKCGTGAAFPTRNREQFETGLLLRNKLTHPKGVGSLRLSLIEDFEVLVGAYQHMTDVYAMLHLNEDQWS